MKYFIYCLLVVGLFACSSTDEYTPQPADPSQDPSAAVGAGLAKSKPEGAVKGLIYDAKSQRDAGLLEQSLSTAERALRLYPDEYQVWVLLIELNLQTSRWGQAEQLANKLLGKLAANDYRRKDVWNQIARAREGRGEIQSASQARLKAQEY